jgi:Mrp family chromosome partitioning ATPase
VLVSFPTVPHRDLVPRSIVPSSGPDEMARPYHGGPQSNRPSVRPAAATPLRPVPPPHDPWREAATASPESGRTREGVRTLMMPYGAPEARPAARRSPTATLRFGTPMDADAFGASSTALAPVRHTSSGAALALVHPLPMVEAVVDEPEIEVVGADVSEGHGVQSLLRGAPANAIAALRVLRHRLDQRRGDDGHFVVSVLSAGAGEGKTTLAIRLALILSEAERARVVLVEANLERPRLARVLGLHIPEDIGLSAQIRRRMAGGSRPWGVIKLAPSLNVLVEPGEEAAFPGALHSTHFDAVLRTLQRNYDYVIIDGPAVLGSGDGNVVEDVSDGVVVVAQAGRTQGTALCRTADQLGDRRIVGVVLNAGPPKGRRSRKARSA